MEATTLATTATITVGGKSVQLPTLAGTEQENAIDISKLRQETGYITLDHGFMNTGSCTSAITFLDGEQGILRYRGIPIEQLAEKSTFTETAYLIIYGELPNKTELAQFQCSLARHSMIHEEMKRFFERLSEHGASDGDPVVDGFVAVDLLPRQARSRTTRST